MNLRCIVIPRQRLTHSSYSCKIQSNRSEENKIWIKIAFLLGRSGMPYQAMNNKAGLKIWHLSQIM